MRLLSRSSSSSSIASSAALLVAGVALGAGCGSGNASNPDGGGTGGCPNGLMKFDTVCVTQPTLPAARTPCGDVYEFCDKMQTTAPVLSCLTGPAKMHPATPAAVTLAGYIHPFSGGKSNAPVYIQVFKAADLEGGKDITTVKPIAEKEFPFDPSKAADATQFRACDGTEKIGPMIGSAKKSESSGSLMADGFMFGCALSHFMKAASVSAGFAGSQGLPSRLWGPSDN